MSLLELRNVSASYSSVQVLKSLSLQIEEGEIVTLLGANGAAKSTTLRTISGLLHPSEGEIVFDGHCIHRLPPGAIVRLGVAHVPERRRIFPGLTVKDNLLLGGSNLRLPRKELEADVDEMYKIFPDLKRMSKALGWTLSGGQQQMLAVARGLMSRPRLLLLDEPSLGLAPLIVQQIFEIIKKIRSRGTTILLVEQNANAALSIADRGYVLDIGKLALAGTAEELRNNEQVRNAYLGGKCHLTVIKESGPKLSIRSNDGHEGSVRV